MKKIILKSYSFNLLYSKELVVDIDESKMAISPGVGFENHASFTLGHLVSGSALTAKYLGGLYEFNPEWEELFRRKDPGDPRKPNNDKDLYPSKDELLSELENQHKLVESLILELDEKRFNEPAGWRFSKYMPTLTDLLYFMCVTHESMHLDQLAGGEGQLVCLLHWEDFSQLKIILKVVPCPLTLSTLISQLLISQYFFTSDSPNPVPSYLRV